MDLHIMMLCISVSAWTVVDGAALLHGVRNGCRKQHSAELFHHPMFYICGGNVYYFFCLYGKNWNHSSNFYAEKLG